MPQGPIDTNGFVGGNGLITLHSGTSSWLYAVSALMAFSGLILTALTSRRPRGLRVFHHLSIMILFTAAIAYFAMASDLGKTPVLTTQRLITSRVVFYARYIDWVITTPLLLLEVLLASGLPLSDIVIVIFFDIVMIVTGLIGALTPTDYKWGFFVFGLVSFLFIVYHILGPARKSALALGPTWHSAFTRGAGYLMLIWMLYPICWGLAEGGNKIGIGAEMIFYGVLDILAKPVFCFMHTLGSQKLDYNGLGLQSGKYSEPLHAGFGGHHITTAAAGAAVGAETVHHEKKKGGLFGRKTANAVNTDRTTTGTVPVTTTHV